MSKRKFGSITPEEILDFISDNEIRFVELSFCDIFGKQKTVTILSSELPRAFEYGVSFDCSFMPGLMNVEESDLVLIPDPSTFFVLNSRSVDGSSVHLFCDIHRRDGQPFSGNCRGYLKSVCARAAEMGLEFTIRSACEFYLFETDERGHATHNPIDQGSSFDSAPYDRGGFVRQSICDELEAQGIHPEYMHHENGPGQNEIDYEKAPALLAADQLLLFKRTVKSVSDQNGFFASFLPKPLVNASGNGLHIRFGVNKNGNDLFGGPMGFTPEAAWFSAGILHHSRELTAFLNPHPNSYNRLGCLEAPLYITWSRQNRSQMMRIFNGSGRHGYVELRNPDPSINPYLAFALVLSAGLDGIEKQMELPSSVDRNLNNGQEEGFSELPATLQEALNVARESEFISSNLPPLLGEKYFSELQKLCDEDSAGLAHDEALQERYFLNV